MSTHAADGQPARKPWWKNEGPLRLIAVIIAALTLIATVAQCQGNNTRQQPEVAPAITTSHVTSATPATSSSQESSSMQPTTPSTSATPVATPSAAPSRQEITLAQAVGEERCKWPGNTGYSWRPEQIQLAGQLYSNGIACKVSRQPQSGYVDFLRPDWANRLQIVAGVSDDSENTTYQVQVTVEDAVTNEILLSEVTSLNNPVIQEVEVTDRLRLRVRGTVVAREEASSGNSQFGFAGEWLP